MGKKRIAINGFGRIGRAALKIMLERGGFEIVAINDLTSTENLAYLLRYDTVYGLFDGTVEAEGNNLKVNKKTIPVIAEKEPGKLPWKDLKIDVVLECTGRFTADGQARLHIQAGAKRVIVSAPTKGGDVETFLLGVNENSYTKQDVISNASCTTNSVAPVAAILNENFGILKGMMTTVHAYTATQGLVDGPTSSKTDFRRGRAAAANIVPSTTGAAIATTKVIPELVGKFDGIALRVPVITGSISDFTVLVKKPTNVEEINYAFLQASRNKRYKGILEVSNDQLVSSDIIGNPASAIVDLTMTKVVDSDLVKVFAWYDNEWGYANRLIDAIKLVTR